MPNTVPFYKLSPQKARSSINARIMAIEAETPKVHSIDNITLTKEGRSTPLRIYYPSTTEPSPLILMIHGGAWVAGNLDTHDNMARYFCKNVKAITISVGYTNSPEGKFPLPLEQCYDALLWTETFKRKANCCDGLAVLGDSAGANMTTALCLIAQDRASPKIDFQVLINPVLDLSCEGTLEPQEDALDIRRWQAMMYLNNPEDVYNPYVSPILAKNMTKLPPALIMLAEFDDLRKEGQEYANKLQQAGIPTNVYCQWNMNHLAGNGARASNLALESLEITASALRRVFQRYSS